MNSWGAPFFASSKKVTRMTSQSEPKWLQKCFQKPSKIDQKTKPKNNTKKPRIWLPKWLQKPSKSEMGSTIFVSKNAFQIQLRFFIVFGAVLPPPGLPLASLLAPFGCLWAPFWRLLAPFACLWAPLGLSLASLRTSLPAVAKFRRDLAEILPRTCREPSKNPPRTRRMNPKQSRLSHCNFFERTSFSDKRFGKIA